MGSWGREDKGTIPAERIRVFHHLPALSPIYCFHTVRVAILSDGN